MRMLILGLALALLVMNMKRGQGLFRFIAILPVVLSPAVVGMVWRSFIRASAVKVRHLANLFVTRSIDRRALEVVLCKFVGLQSYVIGMIHFCFSSLGGRRTGAESDRSTIAQAKDPGNILTLDGQDGERHRVWVLPV